MIDTGLVFIALYLLNVAMAIVGLAAARKLRHLYDFDDDNRSLLMISFARPWIGSAFVIGLIFGYVSKIWDIEN